MGLKLISFCVYGNNPKYLQGILRNIDALPKVYPDWGMRVYAENTLPWTELKRPQVQVFPMPSVPGHMGMLWRLIPAWEPGVERVIFRDGDSVLNVREAAAVQEWVESGTDAHTMQDHPHHDYLPIFGGMWGVKGGVLPPIRHKWASFSSKGMDPSPTDFPVNTWDDMILIKEAILPQIKNSLLRHSDSGSKWSPSKMFPAHPPFHGFVGQQIEADGTLVWPK